MKTGVLQASGTFDAQEIPSGPSGGLVRLIGRGTPWLLAGLGVALLAVAVVYHAREATALGVRGGPGLALLVDGAPAFGVVYLGLRLRRSSLDPGDLWLVFAGLLAGAFVTIGVITATMLVRLQEGRPISEPGFLLLTAAGFGALGGSLMGLFLARTRHRGKEAQIMQGAFAFVNGLIRHDLQNDLGVINARASILRDRLDPNEADSEAAGLEEIQRVADKALNRIESSRQIAEVLTREAELEPIDVAEMAENLTKRTEQALGAEIEADLPDHAYVQANPGLSSVLDNLLQNAVEHNDADQARVKLSVREGPKDVHIQIADNGPGMPTSARQSLVSPEPSTSLGGLTLVGTLVKRYGGTAKVWENEPRGTVVELRLPRA